MKGLAGFGQDAGTPIASEALTVANELIQLVADLIRSKKKRRKFNRYPQKMMEDYGLSSEASNCLYTMDRETVGNLIASELFQFQFEQGEFPLCKGHGRIFGAPLYPEPKPEIFAIDPKEFPSQENVDVVVWGQSFPRDATLELEPLDGAPAPTLTEKLEGTYRCCQIHAKLKQPQPGVYAVRVNSCIGYLQPDRSFTLTVT